MRLKFETDDKMDLLFLVRFIDPRNISKAISSCAP